MFANMFVAVAGLEELVGTFIRDERVEPYMQTVSVSRDIDAPPGAVRNAMADREAFLRAGGFDVVTVDGDDFHLENNVGLLTIELDLVAVEAAGSDLAYEQDEGIFESMVTRFTVEEGSGEDESDGAGDGVTVVGETDFALDASLVGPILDATIIKRQRRKELEGHFDFLEERASHGRPDPDGQPNSLDT